jgi:hypothetical protein
MSCDLSSKLRRVPVVIMIKNFVKKLQMGADIKKN